MNFLLIISLIAITITARVGFLFLPFLQSLPLLGAIALLAGTYFRKWQEAYVFVFITLLLSDLLIQNYFYHGEYGHFLYTGWIFVYAAFLLMVIFGRFIAHNKNSYRLCFAAVGGSLTHWIITNFSVWLMHGLDMTTGRPYSLDMNGLIHCFYLALPFLKNFLLGTLIFSVALFKSIEFLSDKMLLRVCNTKT